MLNKQEIIDTYQSGIRIPEIAHRFGRSKTRISQILKEAGINKLPARRTYNLDESFFDLLNKDNAYALGFIAADGHNRVEEGKLYLTLAKRDQEILEWLRIAMKYDGPIRAYKPSKNSFKPDAEMVMLQICSRRLSRRLQELGIEQQKTHTLKFPSISSSLYCHFIRGYFDGDGCINLLKRQRQLRVIIQSSEAFCLGLQHFLKDHLGIVTYVKEYRGIFQIRIYRNRQVRILMDFLYGDGGMRLSRKEAKYLDILRELRA
jgi:intein/homing endonuclease